MDPWRLSISPERDKSNQSIEVAPDYVGDIEEEGKITVQYSRQNTLGFDSRSERSDGEEDFDEWGGRLDGEGGKDGFVETDLDDLESETCGELSFVATPTNGLGLEIVEGTPTGATANDLNTTDHTEASLDGLTPISPARLSPVKLSPAKLSPARMSPARLLPKSGKIMVSESMHELGEHSRTTPKSASRLYYSTKSLDESNVDIIAKLNAEVRHREMEVDAALYASKVAMATKKDKEEELKTANLHRETLRREKIELELMARQSETEHKTMIADLQTQLESLRNEFSQLKSSRSNLKENCKRLSVNLERAENDKILASASLADAYKQKESKLLKKMRELRKANNDIAKSAATINRENAHLRRLCASLEKANQRSQQVYTKNEMKKQGEHRGETCESLEESASQILKESVGHVSGVGEARQSNFTKDPKSPSMMEELESFNNVDTSFSPLSPPTSRRQSRIHLTTPSEKPNIASGSVAAKRTPKSGKKKNPKCVNALANNVVGINAYNDQMTFGSEEDKELNVHGNPRMPANGKIDGKARVGSDPATKPKPMELGQNCYFSHFRPAHRFETTTGLAGVDTKKKDEEQCVVS